MKSSVSALMTILLLIFAVTACDKTTEPKPADVVVIPANPYYVNASSADWQIEISQSETASSKPGNYGISVYYLADPDAEFTANHSADLIVNGNAISLQAVPGIPGMDVSHFYGSTNLNPGSTYTIGFRYQGKLKMSTDIKVPSPAGVAYPSAFSPHEITMLNWDLPTDNQYQFIELSSFEPWINGGDGTIDRFRVMLNPAFRTYSFAADIVVPAANDIAQTGYNLAVNQFSCKIVNRIMLLIGQYQSKSYYLFNDSNIPVNPDSISNTNADWVVAFNQTARPGAKAEVTIIAKYLNSSDLPQPSDIVSVNVGSQYLELTPYNSTYFHGTLSLTPGEEFYLVFSFNAAPLLYSTLRIPYTVDVDYPQTYVPEQPLELFWSGDGFNQYQFLSVESFKDDGTSCGLCSSYLRQLSGYARTYYIPPNVVENYGAGTEYTLSLKQLNYHVANRVALMLLRNDENYYYAKNRTIDRQTRDLEEYIRRIGLK